MAKAARTGMITVISTIMAIIITTTTGTIMITRSRAALLAVLLLIPGAPAAADSAVSIDDAAWLAGRWVGEGLGGAMEETWAPPAGGQMVGHFQLVQDGAPAFYEILLLDVVEGGLRMRVKHFNPDFTAWEEKDDWHAFNPVSSTPDLLTFSGLSIQRLAPDTIEFVLRMRTGDEVRDERWTMTRAPIPVEAPAE